ncbi:hypothetical protein Bealeia1_01711 [Candidatus Bealeia paramacronuclearis]|uniref:Uncharacterized protein n=1 Tax=Candidatus Bealeia paramacronuclearis TaxID=1921001 RepID=A0ABZ2C7P4_9PROT|nr:hypothetical protein [Candidatus Bealeia paramacronuclearis]
MKSVAWVLALWSTTLHAGYKFISAEDLGFEASLTGGNVKGCPGWVCNSTNYFETLKSYDHKKTFRVMIEGIQQNPRDIALRKDSPKNSEILNKNSWLEKSLELTESKTIVLDEMEMPLTKLFWGFIVWDDAKKLKAFKISLPENMTYSHVIVFDTYVFGFSANFISGKKNFLEIKPSVLQSKN